MGLCVDARVCTRVSKSSRCFFDFVPLRTSHGFLRRPHWGEDFVPLLWTFLRVMLRAGDNAHPVARCCESVISDSDTNTAETLSSRMPRRCFCICLIQKSKFRWANTTSTNEIKSSSNKISTEITMTRISTLNLSVLYQTDKLQKVQFTASSHPFC